MKPVREIVSREIIDDLWGAGYTILPRVRHADPFFVPPEMVPQGRSYQWWHLIHDKFFFAGHSNTGWAPVPASRHDGYFMPAWFVGDIEVNGLGLFEKSKYEVDQEHAANAAKAKQMVTDWAEKNSELFEGEVKIGTQTKLGELDKVETVKIGATKTIENTTKIPRELTPYIAQIFEERDRIGKIFSDGPNGVDGKYWDSSLVNLSPGDLAYIDAEYQVAISNDPSASKWPMLNAIILPYAIENIRKRIKEEAEIGQASEH